MLPDFFFLRKHFVHPADGLCHAVLPKGKLSSLPLLFRCLKKSNGLRPYRTEELFPAGPTGGARPILTVEEAKAKALENAGLTASQVTFTEAKLERDDGREIYDIEFYTADYKEYDYEIDAKTGAVLEMDYDAESFTPPASSGTITMEKAKEIALAKVPGAKEENIVKLELDRNDGRPVYEIEIIYNAMEYEMEISAADGTILEFESESIHH